MESNDYFFLKVCGFFVPLYRNIKQFQSYLNFSMFCFIKNKKIKKKDHFEPVYHKASP
jgi:hypothetical protein